MGRRTTDVLINALAIFAGLLSIAGLGYIGQHAIQARREEDDASALTANAVAGEMSSQRKIAACYMDGCPPLPTSEIISCAWWKIVTGSSGSLPEDAERAKTACGRLSAVDAEIADNARRSLEHRMAARRAIAQPK